MIFALATAVAMSVPIPAVQQAPPWQDWRLARPIVLPRTLEAAGGHVPSSGIVRVAIPDSLYGSARADLADLRVTDARGVHQPFAVDTFGAVAGVVWHDAALSEVGFVPGHYSQAVADTGASGEMHDVLTVESSADQFSAWVEVSASDDEKTWLVVRQRAPIFRFRSDGFEGSLDVHFDRTRARWLRIRVLDGATIFPIDGCKVADVVHAAPELVTVATDMRPDARAPAKQTRLTVDLGNGGIPVSEVRFDVSTPSFHRAVAVLASDDGTDWIDVFDCEIYRDDQGGASLSFDFPEARGRFWRLVVYDRDDAPLQDVRASLRATPRYISFRATAGEHYRLLFGNPHAVAPDYDFAASTSADERAHAEVATLGAYGIAMKPVAPIEARPWTETHAGIIWAALLLAVVVLAWIAIRAMR